jgi:hypothetical protein
MGCLAPDIDSKVLSVGSFSKATVIQQELHKVVSSGAIRTESSNNSVNDSIKPFDLSLNQGTTTSQQFGFFKGTAQKCQSKSGCFWFEGLHDLQARKVSVRRDSAKLELREHFYVKRRAAHAVKMSEKALPRGYPGETKRPLKTTVRPPETRPHRNHLN